MLAVKIMISHTSTLLSPLLISSPSFLLIFITHLCPYLNIIQTQIRFRCGNKIRNTEISRMHPFIFLVLSTKKNVLQFFLRVFHAFIHFHYIQPACLLSPFFLPLFILCVRAHTYMYRCTQRRKNDQPNTNKSASFFNLI